MILYHFPIAQNTVNKTVSENFIQRCICLYVYVHIFYYFSIYWSDTSLGGEESSSCSASLSFHDIVAGSSMKHTRLLITPFAVLKRIAAH